MCVLVLNLYWYWLIVKKLIRIIKGTDNQDAAEEDDQDDEYKKQNDTDG